MTDITQLKGPAAHGPFEDETREGASRADHCHMRGRGVPLKDLVLMALSRIVLSAFLAWAVMLVWGG